MRRRHGAQERRQLAMWEAMTAMSKHDDERPVRDEPGRSPGNDQRKDRQQGGLSGKADEDDITLGDEAQKKRDKMQRQEKAEGD
jgi:hypothetical protein